MELLYIFVIWANLESGEQIELARSHPIQISECDPMQRNVWATEYPIIAFTEKEPIPSVDAACIPDGLLK